MERNEDYCDDCPATGVVYKDIFPWAFPHTTYTGMFCRECFEKVSTYTPEEMFPEHFEPDKDK